MVYFNCSPSAPVFEFPNLAEEVLPGGTIGKPPHENGSVPAPVIMVCLPATMPILAAGFE